MELGSLIWFSSREHPFAVRERHCLDLDCRCTDVWLTFSEVDLEGKELREPLSFEIRVNLRNGRERRPPKRSAEIHALVREFLARFPTERFQEMIHRRAEQRTANRRLETYKIAPAMVGELLAYSDVVYEEGGTAKNGNRFSFFFVFDGRDYLIEDYYCANPACNCRLVHAEFWERRELAGSPPKVDIAQQLVAAFTLEGQFKELSFCLGDEEAGEKLARAWREQMGDRFEVFRGRYEQMRAVGKRSLPAPAPTPLPPEAARPVRYEPVGAPPVAARGASKDLRQASPGRSPTGNRAGRNDPCPCGSGRKFKRCCGGKG